MLHNVIAEFLGTGLMIVFGVGVHCDEVLKNSKYRGSGHLFAITTWGFGISVVLMIFGGVCLNPAMALAQAILGMISWSAFIPYSVAEMAGAFVGALICYVMYADQFRASEKEVDPIAVRNIFSTNRPCGTCPVTILWKPLPRRFSSRQFWPLPKTMKPGCPWVSVSWSGRLVWASAVPLVLP